MTVCVEERRQLKTVIEETDKKKLDLEVKLSQALREVEELCRKFNHLTYELMDSSVADDLQVESSKSVTDKINSVVKPYLSTMNEKLMHDEVLLEKQSYRDKLSTDLKMVKSELDRVREKFRISQARSSADIERLTKLSQELKNQNEELSVNLENGSEQCEQLISKKENMQNDYTNKLTQLNESKAEHKREEELRVQKLQTAFENYEKFEKQRQLTLRKQDIRLQGLLREAQCQHIQLQAINDAIDAIFPTTNISK